jgi:hypothetical protein
MKKTAQKNYSFFYSIICKFHVEIHGKIYILYPHILSQQEKYYTISNSTEY